jgi:hypothetical protein
MMLWKKFSCQVEQAFGSKVYSILSNCGEAGRNSMKRRAKKADDDFALIVQGSL